jgi:hypothetical protein
MERGCVPRSGPAAAHRQHKAPLMTDAIRHGRPASAFFILRSTFTFHVPILPRPVGQRLSNPKNLSPRLFQRFETFAKLPPHCVRASVLECASPLALSAAISNCQNSLVGNFNWCHDKAESALYFSFS